MMGSTTKLSFEEFLQIPEEPGKRFELDEGELIVEPRLLFAIMQFASALGDSLEILYLRIV